MAHLRSATRSDWRLRQSAHETIHEQPVAPAQLSSSESPLPNLTRTAEAPSAAALSAVARSAAPSAAAPSAAATSAAAPSASAPSAATPSAAPHRLPPTPVATYRVIPGFVNVRAEPSVKARILARRFQGEAFEAVEERAGWVRDSASYGSVDVGWLLVDGSSLGVGLLLERVPHGTVSTPPARFSLADRYLPLLARAPKPVPVDGPLPEGVRGPVRRWRVQRPMTLVHAQPDRDTPVVDVVLQGELVWSGVASGLTIPSHAPPPPPPPHPPAHPSTGPRAGSRTGPPSHPSAEDVHDWHRLAEPDGHDWHRLAEPDGWVHTLCPAGEVQLTPPSPELDYHNGRHEREMEALDLFCQARPLT
jgi:hypothetical protein